MRYFFIDTETTGLSETAEAWQIGIVVTDEEGNYKVTLESTCKPNAEWEPKAFEMSGLTPDQLNTFKTPAELMQLVVQMFKVHGSSDKWENTIVCHNAAYDMPIIQRMLKQYAGVNLFDLVGFSNVICTMQALRMLKAAGRWSHKSCALKVIHEQLGTAEAAHTALADAEATCWLFFELIARLKKNWIERLIDSIKRLIKG